MKFDTSAAFQQFAVFLTLYGCAHGYFLLQNAAGRLGIPVKESSVQECARNAVCQYAICLHGRGNEEGCTPMPFFIDESCSCPQGQVCALLDDDIRPTSPFFVYQYHCRHPIMPSGARSGR